LKQLKTEGQIMSNWKNQGKPLVSVVCITYNHEHYIKDAIEGFLIQETRFPFEIIIHDDASTDATAKIVRQYAEKYPNIIRQILQQENQYSQGKKIFPIALAEAKGEYVALCEGDDYWTNENKLQKQVDFMVANPECSWCFHSAKCIHMDRAGIQTVMKPRQFFKSNKFTIKHVILRGGGFYPTASAMFRSHAIKDLPDFYFSAPIGDWPLALIATSKGTVGYIDEIMSVYRMHVPGSWSWRKPREKACIWNDRLKTHKKAIKYLHDFNVYSEFEFEKYLKSSIMRNKGLLFWRALSLPVAKHTINERLQRVKAIDLPCEVGDLIRFIFLAIWILLSRLTRKFLKKNN